MAVSWKRKAKLLALARETVRMGLDIDANVGATALYFSQIFPNAQIHACELAPDNFAVLTKNVAGELHGNKDFALLEYLAPWFNVGLRKKLSSRLFNFQAVRKHGARNA